MIINHNVTALNTHNKLSAATGAQSKSMEKLASGLRINRAGDDAAGLAISEKKPYSLFAHLFDKKPNSDFLT